MRYKRVLMSIAMLLVVSVTLAQPADSLTKPRSPKPEPPIPVELVAGSKGLNFQSILSKRLASGSRFGFLNITTFFADYRNDKLRNEYISQSFLTADLGKGFSVNAGVSVNHFSGIRPTVGLQYLFATKSLLLLLLPRADLTETYNVETFGLIEYKPRFSKQWSLYSRIQVLINYNTKLTIHERSHTYLRIGASYQNFQLGVGTKRYVTFLEAYPTLTKRVAQYHIASFLGVTPTQLSRIRKEVHQK